MNPLMKILGNTQNTPTTPQSNNPVDMIGQINQTLDYVNQNGGNAEQLARTMAKERGYDIDQVLNQAREMESKVKQFGINLGSFFKK